VKVVGPYPYGSQTPQSGLMQRGIPLYAEKRSENGYPLRSSFCRTRTLLQEPLR
jgi:hypothetical protein